MFKVHPLGKWGGVDARQGWLVPLTLSPVQGQSKPTADAQTSSCKLCSEVYDAAVGCGKLTASTCPSHAQIEEHEYEIEELQGALKKKQKPPPRMAELEETVTQYKLHVDHLEKVLRCIDNEAIQPDELEDLKNDFESYLVCAVQHGA